MTNYNVNVNDYSSPHPYRFSLSLKIKHFRQSTNRVINTNGGHTAIFDTVSGLVFSSKCRDDEQFSRRKGVLTCLQKMLQSDSFQRGVPKDNYWIADVKFAENGCEIWIDSKDNIANGPYWWLNGERLSSGLYA